MGDGVSVAVRLGEGVTVGKSVWIEILQPAVTKHAMVKRDGMSFDGT
jgi:hypothetical protein